MHSERSLFGRLGMMEDALGAMHDGLVEMMYKIGRCRGGTFGQRIRRLVAPVPLLQAPSPQKGNPVRLGRRRRACMLAHIDTHRHTHAQAHMPISAHTRISKHSRIHTHARRGSQGPAGCAGAQYAHSVPSVPNVPALAVCSCTAPPPELCCLPRPCCVPCTLS